MLLAVMAAGMVAEPYDVYAQVTTDHVVINEVDINPPGNDATSISEWVELYNPTGDPVDIGGWQIVSTLMVEKTMLVADGTVINPGQFITYAYRTSWFADMGESIELRDASGMIVDKTARLSDVSDDSTSWQRSYDGYDNDVDSDWKFASPTPGRSNGKMIVDKDVEQLVITISSDRTSYQFGQTATISGSVSERVFVEKPYFAAEPITMIIKGPNYHRSVTLYPDNNMSYSTTMDLKQLFGIEAGTYAAEVRYAGASAQTTFLVGLIPTVIEDEADLPLVIETDKASYMPGETVTISGSAPETLQLVTIKYNVTDPSGAVVFEGNSAPVNGLFETTMLVGAVDPVYGTYLIVAEYAKKTATASFEVSVDLKEDARISLDTDKTLYALGDTVTVNGRLNDVWTVALVVEVLQTRQGSILNDGLGSYSGFKINSAADVAGDGSFEYSFVIPDDSARLGDYRITVKGDVGSASLVVRVAADPDSSMDVGEEHLTVYTDKQSYAQNELVTFSGFVGTIDSDTTTRYATTVVSISITDEHGRLIESSASADDIRRDFAENEGVIDYRLTAIPEGSGSYTVTTVIYPHVFAPGNYTATAKHMENTASAIFSVTDQFDVAEASVQTDKEVYGLGQTVTLTGTFPPTGVKHVLITLTKPDGVKINSGATVENQRFSWTWDTPSSDRTHSIREGELRGVKMSVFGVYKITTATDTHSYHTFFKISENPDNDSLAKAPIFVMPSKSLYKPGDKLTVLGDVILYDTRGEGLRVPPRVTIMVHDDSFPYQKIYESKVYPDIGGSFSSTFDLPIPVFKDGSYKITATYGTHKATAFFSMANPYTYNVDEPIRLVASTDKETYSPGQTVTIEGGPNQIIFVDNYDVSVAKKTGDEIYCVSYLCGAHTGPVTRILPDPTASFTHQFEIPDGEDAEGTYEVTIESNFARERITFEVKEVKFVPAIVIEKQSRLSDSKFAITTSTKTVDDGTQKISPISVSGSMITTRGEDQNVNLAVTTESGTCLIGQSEECLIKDSTGHTGSSYVTVNLDDSTFRVVYNGPGERLEKFYIYPSADSRYLPDMIWHVSVVKDDQISRFYQKVAYQTIPDS